MPDAATRPVALTLIWSTVAAFALLGLVVWGVPGLVGAWVSIAIVASALSLTLMVAFWSWSLAFGVLSTPPSSPSP